MLLKTFDSFTVSGSPPPGNKGGKRALRLWAVSVTFWTEVLMHMARDRYALQTKEGQRNQMSLVPQMSSPSLDTRGGIGPSLHTMSLKTAAIGPITGGLIVELRARTDDVKLALLFDYLTRRRRLFQCYVP